MNKNKPQDLLTLWYHLKEDLKILNFDCTRFFMKIKQLYSKPSQKSHLNNQIRIVK